MWKVWTNIHGAGWAARAGHCQPAGQGSDSCAVKLGTLSSPHQTHRTHISTHISAHIYAYLPISTQLQLGVGCGLVSSSWRQCSGRSSSSSSLGGRASVAVLVAGWQRTSGQQMTAEKDTPTPTNMYKSKSGGAPSDGQAREK